MRLFRRPRPSVLLLATVLAAACADAPQGEDRPASDPATGDTTTVPDTVARGDAVSGSASRPEYPELRATLCDTINNSFRCARAIEARQLERTDRASRSGDTLRLALEGGDTMRLVDEGGTGSSVRAYSYQGRWPDVGLSLVHLQYYEGSRHLLIDERGGERTDLPDWPLRSADGRRFAVLSLDLEAGYGPNALQVWSIEGASPQLEWETEPDAWGPADGEWIDGTALRFTQRGYCDALPEGEADAGGYMCDRAAELRLEGNAWRVDGGFPARRGDGG